MNKIVFATNNLNKISEIEDLVKGFQIISLKDIGFTGDIPETQKTIEGNAFQKANFIFERYQIPVFADDTGLEVESLDGRPGVYSARYAGENCTYQDNVLKMLHEMKYKSNRNAAFKTVIAFVSNQEKKSFYGEVKGEITNEQLGDGGFGYDPIFKPFESEFTFAQMSKKDKNLISHRAIAVQKFVAYLNSI